MTLNKAQKISYSEILKNSSKPPQHKRPNSGNAGLVNLVTNPSNSTLLQSSPRKDELQLKPEEQITAKQSTSLLHEKQQHVFSSNLNQQSKRHAKSKSDITEMVSASDRQIVPYHPQNASQTIDPITNKLNFKANAPSTLEWIQILIEVSGMTSDKEQQNLVKSALIKIFNLDREVSEGRGNELEFSHSRYLYTTEIIRQIRRQLSGINGNSIPGNAISYFVWGDYIRET